MSLEFYLNLLDAVVILGISLPSLMMATRIHLPVLRTMGMLLALFFVVHGVYHLVAVFGAFYGGPTLDFLSDGFLEPISYLVLLAFGVSLYRLGK